jgi:hypothetical protein
MPARARETGFRSFATVAALCTGAALLAACGGKVVVDAAGAGGGNVVVGASGSGGGSSTTATTGTGTGTGAGGAGGCAALLLDFGMKLDAAQACNPALSSPQCTGMSIVTDACGCQEVAGEGHPEAINASQLAYGNWTFAGCGPYACESCPPPPQAPWYCDPTSGRCVPTYKK